MKKEGKILAVDDNQDLLKSLNRMLKFDFEWGKKNSRFIVKDDDMEKIRKYKCPYCGTETFEGDRNHYRYWNSNGGHCIGKGKHKVKKWHGIDVHNVFKK